MLVRGLVAFSWSDRGGSAFTKKLLPASSTTLAIWPLAPCAKKFAQRTSVPEISHVVIAVRFIIRLLPRPGRVRAFRKANNNLATYTAQWTVFNTSTKP